MTTRHSDNEITTSASAYLRDDADTKAPPLVVRLLGGFEAFIQGTPLPVLHSRHERLLLVLLILEQGRPLDRSIVASRLWPPEECLPYRAESNLRRSLYNLRRALGPEVHRLPDVQQMARALSLDLTGAEVDVIRFDRLVSQNRMEALEQAVALYNGPLLMEYRADYITERHPGWLWILEERRKRQMAFRKAIIALNAQAQVLENTATSVHYLQNAIAIDPLWQTGYRLLMESLGKVGKYQEALNLYNQLSRQLRRDSGEEPEPEITALFKQLRGQSRRRPQPAEPKKPSPATPAMGNIPVAANRLIGRQEEVVEVIASLQEHRLISLIGAGGVGKTRLAIQVAGGAQSSFPDGAWFVDLSFLPVGTEPRNVISAIANSLELREVPGRDPLANLADHLKGKSLLLVLDNCEHLLEPVAGVARAVLAASPGLRILTTSRQAIGLPGERRCPVNSLSTPDLRQFPVEVHQAAGYVQTSPAVVLFVERAAAARQGFSLNNDNAHAVAEICCRLDGIPLALELAAGRIQGIEIHQLAEFLEDIFGLETTASHRVPWERHRTLHTLIDWSYSLLEEPERRVLRKLAAFRGGWTREAAEAVCADDVTTSRHVRQALLALVDKSLVVFDAANSRYRVLETVRQFCIEKLESSGELTAARQRHLNYFVGMAETAEPHLRGARLKEWFRRVEADHDNFRAALEFSCRDGEDNDLSDNAGVRIAGCLWHFWEMGGYYSEGYEWMCATLERYETPSIPRIRALLVIGILADDVCETEQAIRWVEEGLRLARQLGDRWWTVYALKAVGWIIRPFDPERASSLLEEGVALAREEADPWLLADIFSTIGYHELYINKPDSARERFREGVGCARKAQDAWLLDELIYHLALVACAKGDYDEAILYLDECTEVQKLLESKTRTGTVPYFKANIYFQRGNLEETERLLRASILAAKQLGTPRTMAAAFRAFASLSMALGKPDRAAVIFGAASALSRNLETSLLPVWEGDYLRYEAQTRAALGEERCELLWTRGCMMSLEEQIKYALE